MIRVKDDKVLKQIGNKVILLDFSERFIFSFDVKTNEYLLIDNRGVV